MPALLTHDFFGQDAYGCAMDHVDLLTPDERDAFLLGNQGPDPFFYLTIMPTTPRDRRDIGQTLHHQSPAVTLSRLRAGLDSTPADELPVARAYAAGFLCHYLLDSTMHPLVYHWVDGITQAGVEGLDQGDSGEVHAEIERDFDEHVLWEKRQRTVADYRPYAEVLKGRDEMLQMVGSLYERSFPEVARSGGGRAADRVFPLAVNCFRVSQRVFYLEGSAAGNAVAGIEKRVMHNRYSLFHAMSHRRREAPSSDFDNRGHDAWANPFTGEVSRDSFWDLYELAQGKVDAALDDFLSEGFDFDRAERLTGGLNFSGEPVVIC